MKSVYLFILFSSINCFFSFPSLSGMPSRKFVAEQLRLSLRLITDVSELEKQARRFDRMFEKKVEEQEKRVQQIKESLKKAKKIANKKKIRQLQQELQSIEPTYEKLVLLKQDIQKIKRNLLEKANQKRAIAKQILDSIQKILDEFG